MTCFECFQPAERKKRGGGCNSKKHAELAVTVVSSYLCHFLHAQQLCHCLAEGLFSSALQKGTAHL